MKLNRVLESSTEFFQQSSCKLNRVLESSTEFSEGNGVIGSLIWFLEATLNSCKSYGVLRNSI